MLSLHCRRSAEEEVRYLGQGLAAVDGGAGSLALEAVFAPAALGHLPEALKAGYFVFMQNLKIPHHTLCEYIHIEYL